MNLKSMKFQILLVSTLLFTIWSQGQTFQIEELPEDKAAVSAGVGPYEESDDCKAREAALTAKRPKFDRPPLDYAYYEEIIRKYEPIAGNTELDQKTYEALLEGYAKWSSERQQRRKVLEEKIEKLESNLFEAKNQYTNKSRIAELEDKLADTKFELEEERKKEFPAYESLDRLELARPLLDAKRAQTLLVLWQEYENIYKSAELAEDHKEQELDSVKAEFERVQAQFTQQAQALAQQPDRSETTLQKARALKEQTAAALNRLKAVLLKYDCWPEVQNYIVNPIESTLFKLNRWKVSAFDVPTGEESPIDILDLPKIEEIPEDGENPVDQNKGTTTGAPCTADERAAFANMSGSWNSYRMKLTIGGSCENATGTYRVTEWCEGVDETYNASVARVDGTFTGRMEGGSLVVNAQSPPSPNNSKGWKGTGSCSSNSNGSFSCSFGCGNEFKRQ